MFGIDLDLLALDEKAVVLGASMVYFDETKKYNYNELLNGTLFVKFNFKEQTELYKRIFTKSTMEFWKSQPLDIQETVFLPKRELELTAAQGLETLIEFYQKNKVHNNEVVFVRGFYDPLILKSLFEDVGKFNPLKHYNFREIATAIDSLKQTSQKGKCKIPDFDASIVKQYSKYQICFDVLMLLNGE
jgi:hypothetical protein